jgi:alpha-tubulin suppressor-like RCC1 family protein
LDSGSPPSAGGPLDASAAPEPAPLDAGSDASSALDEPAEAGAPEAQLASAVACGATHACALYEDGLYCWGNNDAGQLGQDDVTARPIPALVPSAQTFNSVAAGSAHTCALTESGTVYCWGKNDRGQLGTGDRNDRLAPSIVDLPARATDLATHFEHTCAILADGALYCWGKNDLGEVGVGDLPPGADATQRDVLAPAHVGDRNFRAVGPGSEHTCAASEEGYLWCWGNNIDNQLGLTTTTGERAPVVVSDATTWQQQAGGTGYACGIRAGQLWCWGESSGYGQGTGAPLGSMSLPTPTRLYPEATWAAVAVHTFHTCALDSEGGLWCWGANAQGQLGLGDNELRAERVQVAEDVSAVCLGAAFTCLLQQGVVSCAGANEQSQLGSAIGTTSAAFVPVTAPSR